MWVRDSLGSVFKAYRALFHDCLISGAQLLKNSLLSFYGPISWKLLVFLSEASNLNIKDMISLLKRDKEVPAQSVSVQLNSA